MSRNSNSDSDSDYSGESTDDSSSSDATPPQRQRKIARSNTTPPKKQPARSTKAAPLSNKKSQDREVQTAIAEAIESTTGIANVERLSDLFDQNVAVFGKPNTSKREACRNTANYWRFQVFPKQQHPWLKNGDCDFVIKTSATMLMRKEPRVDFVQQMGRLLDTEVDTVHCNSKFGLKRPGPYN